MTGRDLRIKWPNDVRVDRRKLAGILVERGVGSVVGLGVNANIEAHDFPEELRETATSIRALTGDVVDRSELARDLIQIFDALYTEARRPAPRRSPEGGRSGANTSGKWSPWTFRGAPSSGGWNGSSCSASPASERPKARSCASRHRRLAPCRTPSFPLSDLRFPGPRVKV